ncbi:C40 family peptidase [Thermomonospora amylolytica]|uniref:C40 family peptidase n=1 Tax=Thermomonospora amylolytica TaxID=1411117 RepID=UPI001F1CEEF1|nr:C40 family peptidase [Thermomonospora amylolytica]
MTIALTPGMGHARVADHGGAQRGPQLASGKHPARHAPQRVTRQHPAGRPQHGMVAPMHPGARPVAPMHPVHPVRPGAHPGVPGRPQPGLYAHAAGSALHGQMLLAARQRAARQRAARHKRARLIAQWQARADRAVRFALAQRGKPYLWGATGPAAYDCSGLVQRAWRRAGVKIPRVTHDQYRAIRKKVPRSRLRPGDLVLFNGLRHVGMYVGRGRFVHAPRAGRTVTTEPLRGYYARNYVGAVRPAWPKLPEIPTS